MRARKMIPRMIGCPKHCIFFFHGIEVFSWWRQVCTKVRSWNVYQLVFRIYMVIWNYRGPKFQRCLLFLYTAISFLCLHWDWFLILSLWGWTNNAWVTFPCSYVTMMSPAPLRVSLQKQITKSWTKKNLSSIQGKNINLSSQVCRTDSTIYQPSAFYFFSLRRNIFKCLAALCSPTYMNALWSIPSCSLKQQHDYILWGKVCSLVWSAFSR